MVKPLTIVDIGDFLQFAFFAFNDYIYFSFVMMVTLTLCLGIVKLINWGR